MEVTRLFILICTYFFISSAWAGAWIQEKNRGLLMNTVRVNPRSMVEVNPFVEWGLANRVTVGGNFGQRRYQESANDSSYGELFARTPLAEGRMGLLSVQGGGGAQQTSLGQKNFYEGRLLAGAEWGTVYFNTEFGLRNFMGQRGNEWRFEQTVGYQDSADRLYLAQIFGVKSWNENLSPGEYDSLEFQLSLVQPLGKNWRVQGGALTLADGRQVEPSTSIFTSLWYRW